MTKTLFRKWPKTPRYQNEEWIITEKIDGSNGCVIIDENGEIYAQSRSKIITPGKDDNFGFAEWVESNKEELLKLGKGYHYGEWWGKGIQRNYGLQERRFSLFRQNYSEIPDCCYMVPLVGVYVGFPSNNILNSLIQHVMKNKSLAAPDFVNFEGLILQSTLYTTVRYKYIINK